MTLRELALKQVTVCRIESTKAALDDATTRAREMSSVWDGERERRVHAWLTDPTISARPRGWVACWEALVEP